MIYHVGIGKNANFIQFLTADCCDRYSKPPRVPKQIVNFTHDGLTCRKRAILELERRFYGNDSEYIFEGIQRQIDLKIELSDRELGCMYLDPRTLLNASIMNIQGWKKAAHLVQEEYVEISCAKKKREKQSVPV